MQRRFRSLVVFLLLPALLYRALVPVGFMPVQEASGRVDLALCSGVVDVATFIAAASQRIHGQHRHQGAAGSDHMAGHAHHFSPCPYALTGSAPLVAFAPHWTPTFLTEEPPPQGAVTAIFLPTILRTQTSRGPPAHA